MGSAAARYARNRGPAQHIMPGIARPHFGLEPAEPVDRSRSFRTACRSNDEMADHNDNSAGNGRHGIDFD
jgi:hypothetical protein